MRLGLGLLMGLGLAKAISLAARIAPTPARVVAMPRAIAS